MQAPAFEAKDTVASGGKALIVGDDDNRDPLFLVETTEEGVESLPRLLIEVSAGLVAQESPGGLDQGPGDGHPLLFSPR